MDLVFAVAYREGVSPVAVAARKDLPIAGTPQADEVLGISTVHREKMRQDRAGSDRASDSTTSMPTAQT
jgi:hypothetical protein